MQAGAALEPDPGPGAPAAPVIAPTDLAYAAALVDNLARLSARTVHGTELPQVTIQGKQPGLEWLAEITGVALIPVNRQYTRHVCSEHCPEAHSPIESRSRRWHLTGARATVVLWNLDPYLRNPEASREARRLVGVGLAAGYKGNVAVDLTRLGWELPWDR